MHATATHPESQHQIADKLVIGFQGTSLADSGVQKLASQLKAGLVGGVILFGYNIVSPEQTKQLIADLKTAAGRHIWVAVDQEGGRVQRLRASNGFTDYLSPQKVGKTLTPEQAYEHYKAMASELADIGFNLNFGCVLDLYASGDSQEPACPIIGGLERSYDSDPSVIAEYATAFVKAHREFGITACLKHYPGHGLAKYDSHAGLVDVTDTRLDSEREPFRIMIKNSMADMIMTAHLVDRNADPDNPISLSSAVLNKWLRQEDGFKGLIIADDLHMGAITDRYSLEDAIINGIKAGSDIVIVSNNKNASPNTQNFTARDDLPEFFQSILAGL